MSKATRGLETLKKRSSVNGRFNNSSRAFSTFLNKYGDGSNMKTLTSKSKPIFIKENFQEQLKGFCTNLQLEIKHLTTKFVFELDRILINCQFISFRAPSALVTTTRKGTSFSGSKTTKLTRRILKSSNFFPRYLLKDVFQCQNYLRCTFEFNYT